MRAGPYLHFHSLNTILQKFCKHLTYQLPINRLKNLKISIKFKYDITVVLRYQYHQMPGLSEGLEIWGGGGTMVGIICPPGSR